MLYDYDMAQLIIVYPNNSLSNGALSNTLEEIRTQYELPALGALAVFPNGSVISNVTGVRKEGDATAATIGDAFHLGSITKAMTATLLAMLINNGTFSWDTTLEEALPDLASIMNEGHRRTTLELLTAHRSGITGAIKEKDPDLWSDLYNSSLSPVNGRQIVTEWALGAAPDVQPNTEYSYTNTNYMIVGHIMDVLGVAWEDLITSALWSPLGMDGCGFGNAPESSDTSVDNPWPHRPGNLEPTPLSPSSPSTENPPTFGPAGTVHCTMDSYAKFLKLHGDGVRGVESDILPASAFTILHKPLDGQSYTPGGWRLRDREPLGGRYLWHTSTNTLNYALAIIPLDNSKAPATAALTNVGDADPGVYEALVDYYTGNLFLGYASDVAIPDSSSSTTGGPGATGRAPSSAASAAYLHFSGAISAYSLLCVITFFLIHTVLIFAA